MIDWLVAILLCVGAAFTLVAAVGILRLPDLYTRMHAITKAGTLGVGLSLLAVAVYYFDLGVSSRAVVAILFVLLTAPVAAHLIGRAAYFSGYTLWEGTRTDALRGRYDEEGAIKETTHGLRTPAQRQGAGEAERRGDGATEKRGKGETGKRRGEEDD